MATLSTGYGGLSRLYDHEYRGYQADLDLYLDRLRENRVRGPLLELGCGTGRVALRLAEAGYPVTGLDLSESMLRRARRRRRRLTPTAAGRLHFARRDMTSFHLPAAFGAVIIAFSTFNMLIGDDQRSSCLACCADHLSPRGVLLMDLFAPSPHPATGGAARSLRVDSRFLVPPWGHEAEKQVEETPRGDLLDVRYRYTVRRPRDGSAVDELEVRFTLAPLTRPKLEKLLYDAGFDVETVYGDYRGNPYGPRSPRLIVEARRL